MHPVVAITEPPLAPARAVSDPAITEVIDLDTGEFLNSVQFISGHLYQALIEERGKIVTRMMAGVPRFVCSTCHVPVYLVSRPEQHVFYFRHRHEDGSCPAETRSPLTYEEICARKYHGLRESEPHKRVKALILRSLDADPSFSNIASERNWRSAIRTGAYRRPDVQATDGTGKFAFEVQLSTTFLSVVVGRREFYRQEGALLIWIFGGFDPEYRLLTTDDLLFSNNSNVFVVDEATASLSERTGALHLRCHYRRPIRDGDVIKDCWDEQVVPFRDLLQDREGQRAYLFDYSGEEASLRQEIEKEAVQRIESLEDLDRRDLFEFWITHGRHFRHTPENRASWESLRARFSARGINLPTYPDHDSEFAAMLNALYSAQRGTPVVWKFNALVQVAHLLAENHPRQLMAFGHAIRAFGRSQLIEEQDTTRRWRRRIEPIAERMRLYDAEFIPDDKHLPLLCFAFPAVGHKVEVYLRKAAKMRGNGIV